METEGLKVAVEGGLVLSRLDMLNCEGDGLLEGSTMRIGALGTLNFKGEEASSSSSGTTQILGGRGSPEIRTICERLCPFLLFEPALLGLVIEARVCIACRGDHWKGLVWLSFDAVLES
jgi:hypothetical protein